MRALIIICSFVFASSGFIPHSAQAEAVGAVDGDVAGAEVALAVDPSDAEPARADAGVDAPADQAYQAPAV